MEIETLQSAGSQGWQIRSAQQKHMTTVETLAELVAIDSVSSNSNSPIVDYLAQRCEAMGLITNRLPYRDEKSVEKINLIAVAGAASHDQREVELALVGHTDTVPYDPNWTTATTLTESDQKLYGRGSCDTKGFIACALSAVETIELEHLRVPLALIFTADEEVGLVGAKHLADLKPLSVRYSIVGEPTSLRPIRAGKGYSLAEVVIRGREAHSAYPSLGVSSIFRAARLLKRIEEIAEQLKTDRHSAFDPPFTTLNVGLIHGGSAKNVIPGECKFTLEWRPIPTQPSTTVLDLLHSAIEEEMRDDPDFYCKVNASRADPGFETSTDSPLVKLLEQATSLTAGTVAFGTEAAQLKALGSDAVVFGPGDIRVAHQTDEFVPVVELIQCTQILTKAISSVCL